VDTIRAAVTARRLAADLSQAAADAAELADEAVWRATRDESAEAVARALGVSIAAVRKAIQQHNRRQEGRPASAETDRRIRAKATRAA